MNGQFKNFNCLFFICKRRHDIKAIMYNFLFSEEGKSECFCLEIMSFLASFMESLVLMVK